MVESVPQKTNNDGKTDRQTRQKDIEISERARERELVRRPLKASSVWDLSPIIEASQQPFRTNMQNDLPKWSIYLVTCIT